VADYRCFFVNAADRFEGFEVLDVASDADALSHAEHLVRRARYAVAIEVWLEGRLVGRVPRQSTLGDVLYAKSRSVAQESDWVALVDWIVAHDRLAMHALYDRACCIVYTLIVRIVSSPETAEELTIDVFEDIWQRAAAFDPANGTVLGWIMTQARSRAIDRLRLEGQGRRAQGGAEPPANAMKDFRQVGRPVSWPTDVLRPTNSLQKRLALRIAPQTEEAAELLLPQPKWCEPDWEQVAPGIECKLLATDAKRHRVSMLVRLAPGASYPAHTHAGVEELHLLDGELWIDDRKLFPGDYNYGEPKASDERVWSETGCMCVLITSTRDILR
jgi:DNA-directed RNA polymerase specialized sigma24 family protein